MHHQQAKTNEEIFEIVDPDGRVIGVAPRSQCHRDSSLLHRVAHVLIVRFDGALALQLRSAQKDIQPNRWDTSVGGHLALGETPEEAAHREMQEELGVCAASSLRFLYRYIWRSTQESELVTTFLYLYNGDFTPDFEEVSAVRFWLPEEIEHTLGQDIFTPNFEKEWQMFCEIKKTL